MKLFLDNELKQHHKTVMIVEPNKEKIFDYFSTFIDALKVLGFNQEQIEDSLLLKCFEYKLIDDIEDDEREDFYNGS